MVLIGWLIFKKHIKKPTRNWWFTFLALFVLTAIFDNVLVAAGFIAYNPELLLGTYIGLAPIEDFFYTLLACLLIPAAWSKFSIQKEVPGRKS